MLVAWNVRYIELYLKAKSGAVFKQLRVRCALGLGHPILDLWQIEREVGPSLLQSEPIPKLRYYCGVAAWYSIWF